MAKKQLSLRKNSTYQKNNFLYWYCVKQDLGRIFDKQKKANTSSTITWFQAEAEQNNK